MPANKSFDSMGDDVVALSTENDALKKQALTMETGQKNGMQSC